MGKGKQKIEQSNDMCLFHSKAITFGSLLKAAINTGLAKYTIIPTISAIENCRDTNTGSFFCPVIFLCAQILTDKCGQSHRKQVIGRKPNPSTLEYAPHPATASLPKLLILDCTTTFAMAITEFWMPAGRPLDTICFSI